MVKIKPLSDKHNSISIEEKTVKKIRRITPKIDYPKSNYSKCWNCGVKLPQNAKICYNCGECQTCKV